jgi:hypothetical protein
MSTFDVDAVQWRRSDLGPGWLVAVCGQPGSVTQVWAADGELLTDFLNDMHFIRSRNCSSSQALQVGELPDTFGLMVISRSIEGEIQFFDPELYWAGVSEVFRAHGSDPHAWRSRR